MSETKFTPGPWAWARIGDKVNGYIIGTIFDKDGNQLSGSVDDYEEAWLGMDEEMLTFSEPLGEKEAATCNYHNASLMAAAPDMYAALEAFLHQYGRTDRLSEKARAALRKARGQQ